MKRSQQPPRPLPFTETQIRERAYKLWQERGESTSSDDNWQAAIAALNQERSPLWRMSQIWETAINKDNRAFTLDVVKVIISTFGVLATIFAGVGLYLTYRNSQAQLESAQQERQLNTERLVTDRFAKAVEQLGSQDVHVRLGGIYSLERIAKDSPKDHWTVMEVLTAYVRNKSPLPKRWIYTLPEKRKPLSDLTMDVQSVLTVIGRREVEHDPERKRLNLSGSNLSGADLSNADLSNADLSDVNLIDAKLNGANLSHTNFDHTQLNIANLRGTDLSSANLFGANLIGVDLIGADLSDATLISADLDGAFFNGIDFNGKKHIGANLSGTILEGTRGINPEQIKQARNWQTAYYDSAFRKQLGLPPEKR